MPLDTVAGSKTSVYIGCFTHEYEANLARDPETVPMYLATGTGTAMLSNRVSWFYDFKGASVTIDTACSSSLTAFHMACLGLRNGEADMALVGGTNLFYQPDGISALTKLSFLSVDGVCHAFDHRANGYARGEGFATVVLKRLSKAIEDGDTIRAVVRATGVNQDGRTPGITLPSKTAQAAMIKDVYASAGLDLATTRFFEAHGTGTPAGDPLEAGAIASCFKDVRKPDEPLYVGAVKSNIGHLEGSSGLAGLIKTVLVLEHGVIPPNIWFEKVNPKIPADEWRLKFPVELTPWPTQGLRRASVNSFGFGGTNSHAVLEDAYNYLKLRQKFGHHRTAPFPPTIAELKALDNSSTRTITPDGDNFKRVFVLSSSDELGVGRWMDPLKEYIARNAGKTGLLPQLAYTLSNKRNHLPWRTFTVAASPEELIENLEAGLAKSIRNNTTSKIGFVFTGQGAQWHAMGRELLGYPVFAECLDAADSFLQSLGCPWSIIDELHKDESISKINRPSHAQPICTAVQIGLVDLLASWAITASRVVGHSSGEIAAAYAAGGLTRESALMTAYFRGSVSEKAAQAEQKGGMMAVRLSVDDVTPYIEKLRGTGQLVVACINSPNSVTVSGDLDKLDELETILNTANVFARRLKVDNAYHSEHMLPVAWLYKTSLEDLRSANSSTSYPTMFSSVTGKKISTSELANADYWVRNMVSPVRFSEALTAMMTDSSGGKRRLNSNKADNLGLLVEVGPHSALQGPAKETLASEPGIPSVQYCSALLRGKPADDTILGLAGTLFCRGYPLNLSAVNEVEGNAQQMLVDLPKYPFNHSQRYWMESRLSRDFRFRKHARHDLLGAPVADWNPAEPRWRHFLRLSENAWIKDHNITGSILYPAAGFLVMALEAARQLAEPGKLVSGYRIRSIRIDKALVVPQNSDGVETMLYMRPYSESGFATSATWREFQLSSYQDDAWTEHCRGLISVEYTAKTGIVDSGREAREEINRHQLLLEETNSRCSKSIRPKQMYENLASVGLRFGPTFQGLKRVQYNHQGDAACTLEVQDLRKCAPFAYEQDHLIHPTTLDGILQIMFPALTAGGTQIKEVMVPTFIEEIWITGSFNSIPGHRMNGYASATYHGFREANSTITMSDSENPEPTVTVRGFRATAITNSSSDQLQDKGWRRLCYNLDWMPDVDLLDTNRARSLFEPTRQNLPYANPGNLVTQLELAAFVCIADAAKELTPEIVDNCKWHHKKYIRWMHHALDVYSKGLLLHQNPDWERVLGDETAKKEVLQDIASRAPDGRLIATIGPMLPAILRGDVDPLQVMFTNNLVEDIYHHGVGSEICYEGMKTFVDTLGHKHPDLNILEVGAGTGSATLPILQALSLHGEQDEGEPRFSHYTYTDISASFFEKAREPFKAWLDRITFKTLNIEQDPASQGFALGTYDVVVAANVIHATKSLDVTLGNVKKLLKPGGRLILFEMTVDYVLRAGIAFGLLPGWWLSEEKEREWGPLVPEEYWGKVLRRQGFQGIDVSFRDFEDEKNHMASVIIASTKNESASSQSQREIVIIGTKTQTELCTALERRIAATNLCSTILFDDIGSVDLKQKFCVLLPELENPVLYDVQEPDYNKLQVLTGTAAGVLWLTRDASMDTSDPRNSLILGLARCIRQEAASFKFATLDLDGRHAVDPWTIDKILRYALLQTNTIGEMEYAERDGIFYIPRIIEANYINHEISVKTRAPEAAMRPFGEDPSRQLTLGIATPGLLNTLQFVEDHSLEKPLAAEEIEVEVKATGVNFMDIMVAMGQVAEDFFGAECSGVVIRTGEAVTNVKPGDRVCGVILGAYKNVVRCPGSLMQKIPDNMPFEVAAAIPAVYTTAYYALYDLARLAPGETVLIHAAAGGVGQAAITLAKLAQARILVTCGSEAKKALLVDHYGIPEEHIFSSRDASFAKGVMRVTEGHGVDVVLNSLAGEALRHTWQCIAPFGRFIEIGKKDIHSFGRLDMFPFSRNVTFASIDLVLAGRRDPRLIERLMRAVMDLAYEGKIAAPTPVHAFPYSEIEKAFRFMQTGKHIGKIVLTAHKEDVVPVVPSSKTHNFDGNASYLIAGGLGGLGRSIASWMASRGAKHIILLSRSGAASDAAKETVKKLQASGVNVAAYPCDVGDRNALAAVLKRCTEKHKMPAVKGCIQGAMFLRDSIFENMAFEDFKAVLGPKVHGSWNLHSLLPADMDFFILLSSTSGIVGNGGQANYCAGNTYQDALARHRISQGQAATVIDLGMVLSVGFVAEREDSIADGLSLKAAFLGIREEEFLAMIDHHTNPAIAKSSLLKSQLVTGIEAPALLRTKGLDEPSYFRDAKFSHIRSLGLVKSSSESSGSDVNVPALLSAADSFAAAASVVCEVLVNKLSRALMIPNTDIDAKKPMHAYGVDSLVAVEVRNWLFKEANADVPVFDIMNAPSIVVLSEKVAEKSKYVEVGKK